MKPREDQAVAAIGAATRAVTDEEATAMVEEAATEAAEIMTEGDEII